MTTDTMDISEVNIPERPTKIARISCVPDSFEDLSDSFKEDSYGPINFEKQYASAYFIRLESLRESTMSAARAKWVETGLIEEDCMVGHVKDYKSGSSDIVLVGVLFKEMCLKPNVLDDIQNNLKISDQFMSSPGVLELCHKLSDTDTLFLEDMEARLQLVFGDRTQLDQLPTGVVVAVLGQVNESGYFNVRDLVLPGCGTPGPIPIGGEACYVAFVSGLRIGSPDVNPISIQLLKDFLMGISVSEAERKLASQISRVIVAGDSLYVSQERDPTGSALAEADILFSELSSVIPVNIMSGSRDPTNFCLPQQPLHSGLFPESRRYGNMTVHTNPFKFRVGSMVFLGTSGQNVHDVSQFTTLEPGLNSLELIANCGYLAPTAPDTLACYPFTIKDPLIFGDSEGFPHVIFAGNQPESQVRTISDNNVRICSIADFGADPSVVLINTTNVSDHKIIRLRVPSSLQLR